MLRILHSARLLKFDRELRQFPIDYTNSSTLRTSIPEIVFSFRGFDELIERFRKFVYLFAVLFRRVPNDDDVPLIGVTC